MAQPTSFLLNYGLGWAPSPLAQIAAFQAMRATGAQLMIVESGLTAAAQPSPPALTQGQLAWFEAAGRRVVAYVDSAVTDHIRAYWQTDGQDWVTEADPAFGDVGPVTSGAPSWLAAHRGTLSWGPGGPAATGYIADLTSPEWKQIVIDQAVAQVSYGYDGVFLDDVGAYLPAGYFGGSYDPAYAVAMMHIVIDVAAAIRVINPNAYVVVNSGLNILFDSLLPPDDPLILAFRGSIDAMLLESQFANQIDADATPQTTTQDALGDAVTRFPDVQILSVEYGPRLNLGRYLEFCGSLGILPNLPTSQALNTAAAPPLMGSQLADRLLMRPVQHIAAGLGGNDRITGSAGNDSIFGHTGRDILNGGNGADLISGGLGADRILGGSGNDTLWGDAGADVFVFAAGGGQDRLRDFHSGTDHLVITSGAESLQDVTLTETPAGLRLGFGGSSVLLVGVTLTNFVTTDLTFA